MTSNVNKRKKNQERPMLQHLVAGGAAGLVESTVCHPMDTIKTKLQLQRSALPLPAAQPQQLSQSSTVIISNGTKASEVNSIRRAFSSVTTTQPQGLVTPQSSRPVVPQQPTGAFGMARSIIANEGYASLYKGLTAVWSAVIPKMAIRFVSFEWYRKQLGGMYLQPQAQSSASASASASASSQSGQNQQQLYPRSVNFVAGLASGLTEAVLVVTPAEVCKIRMQSQKLQPTGAGACGDRRIVKYSNNAFQTAAVIVREEGLGALWRGVVPTMMRQGCNQAVNFTTYNAIKDAIVQYRRENDVGGGGINQAASASDNTPYGLKSYESLILGGFSGGLGPIVNNPLDVIKTRQQRQVIVEGSTPKYHGVVQSCVLIVQEEGVAALWKGIGPRLARIMPGQAITFATYELVSKKLSQYL